MTLIEQARDILKRKDETLFDAHAFLFPVIEALVNAIEGHNTECQRLCAENANCGLKPCAPRRCPECPLYGMVEFD